jgi:hypothetical protein
MNETLFHIFASKSTLNRKVPKKVTPSKQKHFYPKQKSAKFIPAMFYHPFHYFVGPLGMTFGGLCLLLYFLPTIVAALRSHPSAGAIFAVNFFFGWTFIGWIICFVWAASGNSRYSGPYPPYNRSADSQDHIINQLRQLQQLRDEGALTEEEFNRQKASILR